MGNSSKSTYVYTVDEYELSVGVEEDDTLSAILSQMEWEIEVLGELDECSVKVKLKPEQEVNGETPGNEINANTPDGIELKAVVGDMPTYT